MNIRVVFRIIKGRDGVYSRTRSLVNIRGTEVPECIEEPKSGSPISLPEKDVRCILDSLDSAYPFNKSPDLPSYSIRSTCCDLPLKGRSKEL